ncbi:MAG: hypothetical protein L6R39_006793, partial [Caloplaca ligustica]
MDAEPDSKFFVASEKGWSVPRNMAHWANYLGHDIIGDICYGKSFETLTSDKNRATIGLTADVSKLMYISGQMSWVVKSGLHVVAFLPMFRQMQKFTAFGNAVVEQRTASG